ncbi:MAG: hypothetical protein ACLQO7_06315 [Candidatus Bathyarchaeia archaeon]
MPKEDFTATESRGQKVERDVAANVLRTVTPDMTFAFYRDHGQPLGVTSKSLDDLPPA